MIVRVAKRRRFTVMANEAIEDDRLSFRALGLLAYLLSKPDHWKANVAHLTGTHAEGREAVRTALVELETAGYVVRRWVKEEGAAAPTIEYVVHEAPPQDAQEPEMQDACNAGNLGDGNLGPQEPVASKDGEKQTLKEQRVAQATRSFEDRFWPTYPARNGRKVGKKAALALWAKMEPEERRRAYLAAQRYAQAVDRQETIARDAERFLRAGWWEAWEGEAAAVPTAAEPGGDKSYRSHRPECPDCEGTGVRERADGAYERCPHEGLAAAS